MYYLTWILFQGLIYALYLVCATWADKADFIKHFYGLEFPNPSVVASYDMLVAVIYEQEARTFPIDNCSTDEMDALFIYLDDDDEIFYQNNLYDQFVSDLRNLPNNTTAPRVRIASVYDRLSSSNPSANVSSWQMLTYFTPLPYGLNYQYFQKQQYRNVREAIELKVTFVQRLFSEMSGVRENVTHIAVVFLDGEDVSTDDMRNIPHIVHQQYTDIKIFVVVLGGNYKTGIVHLSDTLLVGHDSLSNHVLTMAICNQCMDGWFPYVHSHGPDALSCYKVEDSGYKLNSYTARDKCNGKHSGYLAATETQDEFDFLKAAMYLYVNELTFMSQAKEDAHNYSAQIHIGLCRDSKSIAKRFHWSLEYPNRSRLLLLNNWLHGKPTGGLSTGCAMWQFVWNDQKNGLNFSGSEGHFVDGWVDVGCWTRLSSIRLCEVVLPRRIEDINVMRIYSASNVSYRQALTKGNFIIYNGNIVSVSVYMLNTHFLRFLKERNSLIFPLFDCGEDSGDPRYVSYLFVCDYIAHCINRRDENGCLLDHPDDDVLRNEEVCCNGIHCCDGSCLPLQWVHDGEVDCNVCEYITETDVNDESEVIYKYRKRNVDCAFFCSCSKCVGFSQLNNGYKDCIGPEGHLDETLGKLETYNSCYNLLGHQKWAPKCVYIRDIYGAVLGCRDMSHLQNCTHFVCPEGYSKCPDNYCIPQHYILDGDEDCPSGEDEHNYNVDSCTGNFACWDSKVCLHPDLVCDGHSDCPHRDDELDCNVPCDDGFRCVSGTVTLLNYNTSFKFNTLNFISKFRTTYINLTGADLSAGTLSYGDNLGELIIYVLSHCRINNFLIIMPRAYSRLQVLDVSHNLINTLDGKDIYYSALENLRHLNMSYNRELVIVKGLPFKRLETLDLSHTGLSYLDQTMLLGLPNLKRLDLSFSCISGFRQNVFPTILKLNILDLRGLHIETLYEHVFNGLSISQHLYTSSFELCCPQIRGPNIPHHTCHGPDDVISSCFDLVGANVQRVLLWVVAALAVMGNITVIVYRAIWDKSVLRTGYGLFVSNLGISDFIMGVYLFIIAGADYYYRGVYVLYDKTWRESIACRLAGFLSTFSSETSTFFVFLITLDRFLVMKFPFGQVQFSQVTKIIALLLAWIVGLLLALTPIVLRLEMYSSNGMCLGLPLTTKRLKGWEFSFGVFIVFNFFMCLVIAFGQRAIFRAMSANRIPETSPGTSTRRGQDIIVAKQLSLVALFNFLCWFPVGFMGLLSLGGHKINNDVYAWTTVIVLPINAAANPLLYTIPVLLDKWETFKYRDKMSHSQTK